MSSSFATTRWSQVLAAGSPDDAVARAGLMWLCERQWESLRRTAQRWGVPASDVEDVVQDFCCRLIERRADLGALDPQRGRFRAWLLTVFRHFISDRRDHQQAQRRGGGAMHEGVTAEHAMTVANDDHFDRDWADAILHQARQHLRREQEAQSRVRLVAFVDQNADASDYAQVGRELGMSEGAVKVAVHRLRQRFAELVRQEIAETLLDPTSQAVDDELAALIAARRNSV